MGGGRDGIVVYSGGGFGWVDELGIEDLIWLYTCLILCRCCDDIALGLGRRGLALWCLLALLSSVEFIWAVVVR